MAARPRNLPSPSFTESMASQALRSLMLATSLGGLLLGCTQEVADPSDPSVSDDSAIVGGKKVTKTDPIAKVTVSIVDANPDVGQFCTGIAVDRDVVLSAAHCFDDPSRTPLVHAAFGDTRPIAVRVFGVHAQYSEARRKAYDASIERATSSATIAPPSSPLNDLVVLILDEPLPSSITPAAIASSATSLKGDLVSAGFGCTTTVCRGAADTLRKVPMRLVRTASAANAVVLDAGARHGTCFGDSGGPDLVVAGTTVRAFAMISTGPESCEAGISVDTLLGPYETWVRQTAQALRAGRTAPEARTRH